MYWLTPGASCFGSVVNFQIAFESLVTGCDVCCSLQKSNAGFMMKVVLGTSHASKMNSLFNHTLIIFNYILKSEY